MDDTTQNLPLLPLTSGVVLPGMVFTMALESDEAKAAAEAARAADGHFVVVPYIEGRYASVGVVAEVMETGELPGGMPAVAVRGVERARLGTAVPGTGQALWVEVEVIAEGPVGDDAAELAREYRAVLENILLSRGAGRIAERLGDVTDPGRIADMAGYSPDLSLDQKVEVLETIDVADRLRLVGDCDDMPAALMLSDVVVHASTQAEAFGRVVIEAQAMARPVIAADLGGPVETVEHEVTGLRVPPGDAAALAAAIERVLALPLDARRALGAASRAAVLRRYTVRAMQEATLDVYEAVMGG